MGLLDRIKKHRISKTSKLDPNHKSKVDQPMIGSELFEGSPATPRDLVMPVRLRIQDEYKSEGRDPGSLDQVPNKERDEIFWMTYIDSLTVFERYDEAFIYVNDALARYPSNPMFSEVKCLLEKQFE